jgi:hypothetical protein
MMVVNDSQGSLIHDLEPNHRGDWKPTRESNLTDEDQHYTSHDVVSISQSIIDAEAFVWL